MRYAACFRGPRNEQDRHSAVCFPAKATSAGRVRNKERDSWHHGLDGNTGESDHDNRGIVDRDNRCSGKGVIGKRCQEPIYRLGTLSQSSSGQDGMTTAKPATTAPTPAAPAPTSGVTPSRAVLPVG